MKAPNSLTKALRLLAAAILISPIQYALAFLSVPERFADLSMPSFLNGLCALALLCSLFLIRARIGWPRYVLALYAAIGITSLFLFSTELREITLSFQYYLGLVNVVLVAISVSLLFSKSSRAWFESTAEATQ